jgi:hypothetical protein
VSVGTILPDGVQPRREPGLHVSLAVV